VGRIRVLDRVVADRIAAGEVVERPASVVKELVENSLDAGAQTIVIEVEQAGLRLIRVGDDGGGMDPDDAPLAVQRFATSKIASADDLERVATYGFRGEALPSIAAVSRLDLMTRSPGTEAGTRVSVEGGGAAMVRAAGAAPGTVVAVADLFFNTPARRKFLRSPAREFALITDAVQRLALAAPGATFRLRHEGREVFVYPAAIPEERLAQVLGRDLAEAMTAVRGGGGEIAVRGWAVRPERARPSRQLDYLNVNGRPIQSRMLSRAVLQGYTELLPVGRFPLAVIFLEVAPHLLDVNIHPRKLEVRFTDDHRVFATVARAVREALLAPGAVRHVSPLVLPGGIPAPAAGREEWQAETIRTSSGAAALGSAIEPAPVGGVAEAPALYAGRGRLPPLRLIGQILRTYLLAEAADGLVLIDQHAAHERVVYERLWREIATGDVAAQTLAVPQPIELNPAEAGVLDEFLPAAAALGFAVEPFGGATLLVRAVPAALARRDPQDLIRRALDALAEPADGDDARRRLAIATACHTAVRAGDALSAPEMEVLLRDLTATEDPYTCFHGRPTMVWVSRPALERWFLRK